MSDLHRRLKMSRLPPMPPNLGAKGGPGGKKRGPMRRDYTPVTWDNYFERKRDVKINNNDVFRVYESGSEGPVCCFLHGGGFCALSWALLSQILIDQVQCRCVAVDLRGHGDSHTEDEDNLSAEQLSSDVGNIMHAMYGDDLPPVILVGHSMGGAIAVHTAHRDLVPSLIGLVVIDVVEGTAMEALSSMQTFLLTRPKTFKSVEYAVEWCVRSGQVRNLESAKVSMVGQVKRLSTNETATSEISHDSSRLPEDTSVIQEEEEESSATDSHSSQSKTEHSPFKQPAPPTSPLNQYTWRLNLSNTEKYWPGWFKGLSKLFLSCNIPKILLLAGVDRLDKDLAVGQMQGKFQMNVLPQCGHAVHEDVPDKVADLLAMFLVRHKFAQPSDNFQRAFPSW